VTVSNLRKTPLPFSPRDWVPLKDALLRIMSITGSRDLALACLNRDLRSGQLGSGLVPPDGKAMMIPLEPSDWRQRTVHAPLNPEEGVGVEPYVAGQWFVRRVDLDKWYPTPTTMAQSDDTASSPPTTLAPEKQKPGIKPFNDWPNRFLAPEMVRVAYETPGLLRDRPELVRHVRKFLKDEIGWEPHDNKPIHRELDRLLSRIK
jgi:hypothetical protein